MNHSSRKYRDHWDFKGQMNILGTIKSFRYGFLHCVLYELAQLKRTKTVLSMTLPTCTTLTK